jgi:hypothetical protein
MAVAQYRSAGSVRLPFSPEEWREGNEEWFLDIPYARHGCRSPAVTVVVRSSTGGWEEVMCGVEYDERNNVRIAMGLGMPPEARIGEVRIS